ncbi:hypothetical protein LguiB_010674 [Lonicera macranthoides]
MSCDNLSKKQVCWPTNPPRVVSGARVGPGPENSSSRRAGSLLESTYAGGCQPIGQRPTWAWSTTPCWGASQPTKGPHPAPLHPCTLYLPAWVWADPRELHELGAMRYHASAVTLEGTCCGPISTTFKQSGPDHYPSHYTTTAVDPYPPPSSRVEVPSEYYLGASGRAYPIGAADRLPRETYPVETSLRRETYPIETLPRRETYLTRGSYVAEADSLRKRERDDSERLYSAHASSALSDYNRTRNYQGGARPESSSLTTSVSARYSFAGPSSYR